MIKNIYDISEKYAALTPIFDSIGKRIPCLSEEKLILGDTDAEEIIDKAQALKDEQQNLFKMQIKEALNQDVFEASDNFRSKMAHYLGVAPVSIAKASTFAQRVVYSGGEVLRSLANSLNQAPIYSGTYMLELLQKVDSLPPALKCFTLASIQNAQQRLQIRFDEDAQVIFDEKIAEYEDNQGMANWLQFIQMEAFGPLGILPSLLSSSNYFEDKLVALMLELAIKSSQKWWVKTVQQQQIIKKEAQARQGEVSDGMQKLNNAATNKDDKAMGNLAKSLDKLPGVNKDFIKDALHRAIRRCPQSMDAALEPLILWLKKEKGCDIDLSKVLPPRVEEVDPRLDALASSDNIYEKMAGEVIKLCSDDSMNVEQKMDRLQYLRSLQGVVDNKEKNAVNLDKLSRRKEKISAQVSSAQQSMQETVSLLNNIIKLTHEMALQSSRLG